MKRPLLWRRELPDHRDLIYSAKAVVLPKVVDLRAQMSPVEDQGELGSCTANALAGNIEYLKLQQKIRFDASRLFIYYNERYVEGTVREDAGAEIRDGIKTLAKYGVCSESLWPYNIRQFASKPPVAAFTAAKSTEITKYLRILTLPDMLSCLAAGFPFVFGIPVYPNFDRADANGMVPMPGKNEKPEGGHAICAVGYRQADKMMIVRNSWGADWGDQGYCYIPFDYMSTLAADNWTIRA